MVAQWKRKGSSSFAVVVGVPHGAVCRWTKKNSSSFVVAGVGVADLQKRKKALSHHVVVVGAVY